HLKYLVCSTKDDAIDTVRNYPIAVVVLDQRMPEISGTDLYSALRDISPRLRAIMLSGEADTEEVGQALDLGYKRYLHKTEFRELPALVLREYTKYQLDVARSSEFEPVYLFSVRHLFGLRGLTEFWLQGVFVEDETFIHKDGWRLIHQINCGEK